MRNISAENLAALQAGRLVARDFLWIVARRRDTGAPVTEGLWSDVGDVVAEVVHPDTGLPVARTWHGSGTLVVIDDIPLVANLTVQTVTVRLSQILDRINQLIRDYDCQQARVEIYRGLFSPDTRLMVAPAEGRFVGFVDRIEIKTPAENQEGGVDLICVSHTQEMTRSNPDTRSHESQLRRNPTDAFYKDTAVVGEWEFFWGSIKGKVPSQKKESFWDKIF